MTVQFAIGPREKTNQSTDPEESVSFITLVRTGPYSDPSSRNYGHMSDNFFMGWIKRAGMQRYFLKDNRDEFIHQRPDGFYLVTIGMVRDLENSLDLRMSPSEVEMSRWILDWIEKLKGKPDLIIELR